VFLNLVFLLSCSLGTPRDVRPGERPGRGFRLGRTRSQVQVPEGLRMLEIRFLTWRIVSIMRE